MFVLSYLSDRHAIKSASRPPHKGQHAQKEQDRRSHLCCKYCILTCMCKSHLSIKANQWDRKILAFVGS